MEEEGWRRTEGMLWTPPRPRQPAPSSPSRETSMSRAMRSSRAFPYFFFNLGMFLIILATRVFRYDVPRGKAAGSSMTGNLQSARLEAI
jgi:hypothetical protein